MAEAGLIHGSIQHKLNFDPNAINWTYNLNTHVDETYGGRVVQVLSAYIGDITIQADGGSGGWKYLQSLALFCRDFMYQQKETGRPGIFRFPQRGWEFKVYLSAIPFSDSRDNVKKSFMIKMKVQEDISGVLSGETVRAELNKLRNGIGYEQNKYNFPNLEDENDDAGSPINNSTVPDALLASGTKKVNNGAPSSPNQQEQQLQGNKGGGRTDWTGKQQPWKNTLQQTNEKLIGLTKTILTVNSIINRFGPL